MSVDTVSERDLFSLFDVSWASDHAGLESYTERILVSCVRWFEASGVSLFLRQDQGSDYLLAAQAGPGSRLPEGTQLRTTGSIAAACIAEGRPMLVRDPLEQPELFGEVVKRHELGSAVVVPLLTVESGCIGVLNVSRTEDQPRLTEADLQAVGNLAIHIALAVSNARLFARMNIAVNQARAVGEKLDSVIACLGVGIVVLNQYEELTDWNPEAEGLLGSSLKKGARIDTFLAGTPSGLRFAIAEAIDAALEGERTTSLGRHQERSWSVVASPLRDGGATLAIQEVSDHELALKEVNRVRRLAEIGQMTAAVAHEIRNPLTGIRSAAQMVQLLAEGEAAEFGKIIEEEALKLNALCDQFLEFARPMTLNLREVDLGAVLRHLVYQYQPQFARAGVTLELEIAHGAPTINADPLRIEQVFHNLLLNALQACRSGGAVAIRLEQSKVTVLDNGEGIEAPELHKLFTPFFTTKANGSGLGLSTVRKIVDAHGWQVRVDSVKGRGTKFEVTFDRAA